VCWRRLEGWDQRQSKHSSTSPCRNNVIAVARNLRQFIFASSRPSPSDALLTTLDIRVPSFFVLNTLLRTDFPAVLRILPAGQAGLTIVLAPYTLLWYASSANYPLAVRFKTLVFAIASIVAQWTLSR
jgi:hypothetical protein